MKAIFVLKDCMRSTCTKASTRTIAGSVLASGAMAAAQVAAAPKKHAAALQAPTAAAQVQVTKSALLLSGKFFRPGY